MNWNNHVLNVQNLQIVIEVALNVLPSIYLKLNVKHVTFQSGSNVKAMGTAKEKRKLVQRAGIVRVGQSIFIIKY